MCVSQTELIPLPIPPPRFPVRDPLQHRQKSFADDSVHRRYRVIRYATAVESSFEKNESTGEENETKTAVVRVRVFYDGKGVEDLNDFLSQYPKLDAWRPGSAFDVQIYSNGGWKKISCPPY